MPLIAHQPKLKEIALIGEKDFFIGIQTLGLNKTLYVKDESLLATTSNFQIFMTIMSDKEGADKKYAVQQVCALLFPKFKLNFTPRSLVFIREGESVTVDENNFNGLQAVIREICCLNDGPMDQQAFNPADDRAREIAEKLMVGRQKVAEAKGQSNISIFSQYLSILTVGLHSMSLQDAMDLTMFQLYDLVERYMLYINWDMDVRSRLAGGKPESQPDNWMKSIH
jgi:hypothetical protein